MDKLYFLREGGRILRMMSHFEMSFLRGYALPPYSVSLWLTNRCNLRCSFCWVEADRDEIEPQYYYSLIEQLSRFGTRIGITGGEPLLYDNCMDIIKYAKSKGLKVGLNTNGLLISKYADELLTTPPDNISISIDGPPEVHDEIRGMPGAYEKAIKGVKRILSLRDELALETPSVRVLITICKDNLNYIPQAIDELDDMNLDCLVIQHLWFTNEKLCRENEIEMRKHFNRTPDYLSQFIIEDDIPGGEDVLRMLSTVKDKTLNTPLELYPDLSSDDILRYYDCPDEKVKSDCHSRWFRADVMPDGDVTPCLGYVVGNIKEKPFWKIWNGLEFRRFRRVIESEGTLPGCNRCCGLFSD